ncbi:MAG TPA: hypothetical protein VGB98_08510 [Pyrinomonadaceae bacterium]|jgi:hypothetical protein
MKKTKVPTRRKLFPLLAALCLCGAASAQPAKKFEPTPAQAAEAARLRGALAGALGEDFELARERLARRSDWHGGGLYWLAHLRAKRPGGFHVKYKYRYKDRVKPQDPLYTFVERRTFVRVGPRGCARRPRSNSVCVGDTVILPVVVNDYTEHTFSIEAQPYAPGDGSTEKSLRSIEEAGLYREPVPNPAEKFLRYLGSRAHYSPHRAMGYTMSYDATFEAVAPGSFNLAVGATAPAAGPLTNAETASAGSVPVVIVAPGTPVTVLSSGEDVHGYTERFSSRSGENYQTTPLVLQPGDRITLKYSGYSRRGRSPGGENREALEASVKDHAPVITLLPFRVDPARDFDEWIVDFYPPSRRE